MVDRQEVDRPAASHQEPRLEVTPTLEAALQVAVAVAEEEEAEVVVVARVTTRLTLPDPMRLFTL